MTSTAIEPMAYWLALAAEIEHPSWAWIDGHRHEGDPGQRAAVVSPRDRSTLSQLPLCGEHDVDRAVASARAAFDDRRWSGIAPSARREVLLRLAHLMERDADRLALTETLDMGKPIINTRTGDVPGAVETFVYFADAMDKHLGEIVPVGDHELAMVTREPLGVVGAVVPWNFPLLIACWKLAPALAAGNSVVLKPSIASPLTALRLAELAAEAGLPAGVLNVVIGHGAEVGTALGRHPGVDKLTFTGSPEVGRLFLHLAADSNLKPVSLELGGKAPNVVLSDAPDLDLVADRVTRGIFLNQGASCTAGSRLIVDATLHDELVERIVARAAAYRPMDPLDPAALAGSMVDATAFERVCSYIQLGKDEGASLALGGAPSGGWSIEPTVFTAVQPAMRIAREEIFGPVLSVIRFRDPDEALAIANGTQYGLNAAVWTKDLDRAHRFARKLRTGMVTVNGFGGVNPALPFGGVGLSGSGRDNSLHALDGYSYLKSTRIILG